MTDDKLSNLRVDAITNVVQEMDWSAHQAGDSIGYDVYESVTCDKCGEELILSQNDGGAPHCEVDPDGILPPCELGSHHGKAGPCEDCVDSTGEEGVGVCMCDNAPCDGYVQQVEGPMMNYLYPCPIKDPGEAARNIAHLPLCVVEFPGGPSGFALTGGGMDFSWEICAAYVACGYLPPTEFDLPKMGEMTLTGWHLDVWQAMRRSIQVQQNWLNNSLEKLDELKKWVEDKDAKSKAKNAAREAT